MSSNFPHLQRLAYDRLDEDWDLVDPDPDGIVRRFAKYEGTDATRALIAELGGVLNEDRSNEDLEEWWLYELRSGFEPVTVGMTYREWFQHIADVLRSTL